MRENYNKSAIQIMKDRYEGFTETEKVIADFFIRNTKIEDFSIKTVAGKLYVSCATISRFASKCGYIGYRELVRDYERSLVKNMEKENGGSRTVLGNYQDILDRLYNMVDDAQIVRIVKYMNDAERVHVFGKGSSGISASEMKLRFMRVGVNIDAVNDSDIMRMQTVFLNEHNLVFGISVSGTTAGVIWALKEAHLRGAKTVLLTMNSQEALTHICDEILLIPNIKGFNQGNTISPQFPVLVMIDILYSCFLKRDKTLKENFHNETVWALKKGKRELE